MPEIRRHVAIQPDGIRFRSVLGGAVCRGCSHAIIAPDSHHPIFWSSPDTAEDSYTTDWYHIQVSNVQGLGPIRLSAGFIDCHILCFLY